MDHDSIYGADRDYVKNINWATGLGAEANCDGNVTLTSAGASQGARYIVSGATLAPGRNFCDRSGLRTIYPSEDRDAVFASFMQEFGDNVTFDMHALLHGSREHVRRRTAVLLDDASGANTAFGTPNRFSVLRQAQRTRIRPKACRSCSAPLRVRSITRKTRPGASRRH